MAALPLQGEDPAPGLWEGAAPGDDVVPASADPSAGVALVLEAIVGELQGVSVTGPRLGRLKAGAEALQAGEKALVNFQLVSRHTLIFYVLSRNMSVCDKA